jgi:hypothetical protein
VKKQKPLLTGCYRRDQYDFAIAHRDELWRTGSMLYGQMRLNSTTWGQMEGSGCGSGREKDSDRTVQGKEKFGGGSLMMWGCMLWEGAEMTCQIDGVIDGGLYIKILDDELGESLEYYGKTTEDIIFQQDNNSKHTSKNIKK